MTIRPAATLALLRDVSGGLEVLLLQRTWNASFMPGYYVFPGGTVDADDQQHQARITGVSDRAVSQTMSLDQGGAAYMIAALRECFEEAGLLLANGHQGKPLTTRQYQTALARRHALCTGEGLFSQLCEELHLTLPLDRLAYLSHWITPPGLPRRFDTRFFVARAPQEQPSAHDGDETIDHLWVSPREALERHHRGELLLSAPTLRTLRVLSDFTRVDALLAYAHANPPAPRPSIPWPALQRGERHLIEPDAPAYDEVRKLDPQRHGSALAEITPGSPVCLGAGVFRLTAPNPGMMTGPGTNTYLLSDAQDTLVIDPGPADPAHIDAILTHAQGPISRILVTHTHSDHSPGARLLQAATGARVMGMPAPAGGSQDSSFKPDTVPVHGETLPTAAGPLKVIHTPGHASNHLCYLLTGQRLLFSGDHIMQGSTVVINPPDGDMKAYLDSLNGLHTEHLEFIAPGHGFLMGNPHAAIDHLVTHRLAREHKIIDAMAQTGPASSTEITKVAYDDVPTAIHPLARRSLLAHLFKLEQEDRVAQTDDHWRLL
ncbi:MBL fold metallo-hydrolase [Marinobacter sp. X15-166B]|uniref:MBL fold metallo-hydrolase n=1 Tax=Marinobacter sp. X15-166B TaxID=1897620 RepID=UPI00085C7813|nr:MBL fold metallo-hydrolase [Marinobacter sp. X15-166B]OEY65881.1 MBL fold metallo-hydrolase [Marinobacter sp. X15-166B]